MKLNKKLHIGKKDIRESLCRAEFTDEQLVLLTIKTKSGWYHRPPTCEVCILLAFSNPELVGTEDFLEK